MKLTVDATLTPDILAQAFCEMNDEAQAQFFIEVANIAATWKSEFGPGQQWFMVGRHLRDCGCSNEAARQVVTAIAEGIEGRDQ